MELELAKIEDLDIINDIYKNATENMIKNSIFQWDEIYPNKNILEDDIVKRQLYKVIFENNIISTFVLNKEYDNEYSNGIWSYNGNNFIVLHRLCINIKYQNMGLGTKIMLYNEIIKYEENYYGFQNVSMEMGQLMNISSITKIDNLIPDVLTFFVCWLNQKGYVYWLYSFNDEQKIIKHYYCGDFNIFENYKILMEKISGKILDYGSISIGDFNKDGKNEIALYSFYKNIGNSFCVYGFNNIENELEILCLVPVFINYDNPFPSVEYIGNGFKILEIIEEDYLELSWNNYMWNTEIEKYVKQ